MLRAKIAWYGLILLPLVAQGGKSVELTPDVNSTSTSIVDPLLSASQAWRIEFQMHDWTLPAAGNFSAKMFQLDGTGASAILFPNGLVALNDFRDQGLPAQPCFVNVSGLRNALVRFQRDLAQSRVTCEAWSFDGTGYNSQTIQIVGTVTPYVSANGSLGGGAQAKLGFLRIYRDVLPMGSRPPTTAATGEWTELRFDNNGTDSSGNGHNATIPGVSYVDTPDQRPSAVLRTVGSPSWSPWVSLRAGHPATLDGSSSFTLADGNQTLTYLWQQLDGPTRVQWSSRAVAQPVIRGLVFGSYTFLLQVKDVAGNVGEASLEVGAVAYDDNGVVIPPDPKVTAIFGPMIAFGKNPWGWMDERAMQAHTLQLAGSYESAPPSWSVAGSGTIAYPLRGIGPNGQTGTTLTAAISMSQTSLAVADASRLPGLASLPTWVLIGNAAGGGQEVVRVTATTATSGPATLTVDYDGRGVSAGVWSALQPPNSAFLPAQAWPAGTSVGEFRVSGTGTQFISDAASALCPAGAGPMGTPFYQTGTVTLTGGSSTLTGNGTNWTDSHGTAFSNQVFATNNAGIPESPYLIRVEATHGGGIPFVWWAQLVSVGSTVSTTWSRPLPSDVDAGPFPYVLLRNRLMTLSFSDEQGTYRALFDGAGCQSETKAFGGAFFGFAAFTGSTNQTGQTYSWVDSTSREAGVAGAFGPNFYGTGLAQRALYYRSGLKSALKGARAMDDYWLRDPHLCGGWGCAGSPLLIGGGLVGAFASLILDPETKLSWSDIRQFIKLGAIGGQGCNAFDTRDAGYLETWLALGALYDPDVTFRNQWKTNLQAVSARNNTCRNQGATGLAAEQDSWANGFLWAPNGAALSATPGSKIVTGSGIAPGICRGIASGNALLAHQSSQIVALTGTFENAGNAIIIAGTRNGQPFVAQFQTGFLSNSRMNLSGTWEGDTGEVTWMQSTLDLVANSDNLMTIATSSSDLANLKKNWECMWNSATSITLNRPWDGAPSSSLYSFRFALAGYGQQPYMLGIKALAMQYGSQLDGALGTNFAENQVLAGSWIQKYGYDEVTQGMHYGRLFQLCEPPADLPSGNPIFDYRTPNCNRGLELSAVVAARELTQETMPALLAYYASNPSPESRFFVDRSYGSLWCSYGFTLAGFYCDASSAGNNPGQSNLTDAYLSSSKWVGYFFGIGMAHQWPAARVGGVEPARTRTVQVSFTLGTASSVRLQVTAATGATTEYTCGSVSPCAISVDDRLGEHWMKVQYLSAANAVIRQADPVLLATEIAP